MKEDFEVEFYKKQERIQEDNKRRRVMGQALLDEISDEDLYCDANYLRLQTDIETRPQIFMAKQEDLKLKTFRMGSYKDDPNNPNMQEVPLAINPLNVAVYNSTL